MVYSRVVADIPKETPKRVSYKAAEVCEIAHIQPYVLRSWESEFPRLGVLRAGTRIYRHADLEQVLRIKRLVFEEGLTLGGARRRLEEENGPAEELPVDEFVTPEMRQRIGHVKAGLRQVLTILGSAEPADGVPAADDREAASGQRAGTGGDAQTAAASANGRNSRAKTVQQKAPRAARAKAGRVSRASERPHRRA